MRLGRPWTCLDTLRGRSFQAGSAESSYPIPARSAPGGEIRQPYREGQEDQLGALGLVVNTIALWNTRYMDVALGHLRAAGNVLQDEDIARLSPLVHEHINLHGRYYFGLAEALQRGELRALRDPRNAMQEL